MGSFSEMLGARGLQVDPQVDAEYEARRQLFEAMTQASAARPAPAAIEPERMGRGEIIGSALAGLGAALSARHGDSPLPGLAAVELIQRRRRERGERKASDKDAVATADWESKRNAAMSRAEVAKINLGDIREDKARKQSKAEREAERAADTAARTAEREAERAARAAETEAELKARAEQGALDRQNRLDLQALENRAREGDTLAKERLKRDDELVVGFRTGINANLKKMLADPAMTPEQIAAARIDLIDDIDANGLTGQKKADVLAHFDNIASRMKPPQPEAPPSPPPTVGEALSSIRTLGLGPLQLGGGG